MDLSKPNKADSDRLTGLYLISNTPHFLYKKMRSDPFVQLAGKYPIDAITDSILKMGRNGISSMDQLAYLYALYISLTYKEDYERVRDFYNTEGAIGFEWFPEIKSIYLSSVIPTKTINLSLIGNISPHVDIFSQRQEHKQSPLTEINLSLNDNI